MGDWQNLSGLSREQENGGEKEKVVEAEKEEEDKDVMTRWWDLKIENVKIKNQVKE